MNNRPARQQLAGGTGRRTTNSIVHTLSTLCTTSAVLADLLATWARSRRDAASARLATDALTVATNAHALQERLAAALESECAA